MLPSPTGAAVRLVPPVVYFVARRRDHLPRRQPAHPQLVASAGPARRTPGDAAQGDWPRGASPHRAYRWRIPRIPPALRSGWFRRSSTSWLADAITYLGGSLLIRSWWPLLARPDALLVMRRKVIDREERHLTERIGDAYREYQLRVRRWLW